MEKRHTVSRQAHSGTARGAWTRFGGRSNIIDFDDDDWRRSYPTRPYVQGERPYEDYRPAFRYGYEAADRYRGHRWEEVESDLGRAWGRASDHRLAWAEIKEAVHDAWNNARFGSTGDPEWDQIYPARSRPGVLQVPLQELHDPENGRLDASKVAEYLEIPLQQLATALGKPPSSAQKTPTAADLQPFLLSLKTILVILEDVMASHAAVLAWLNQPHPDLGQRSPLDVILQGYPDAVKHMLQSAVIGTPS